MPEHGGQRPPIEYRSPTQKADGSLVRIDDPNRPPTGLDRLRQRLSNVGDKVQDTPLGRFATWLTAWREPLSNTGAGKPAGPFTPSSTRRGAEIIDLHGPTVDSSTLSAEQIALREQAKRRHPSWPAQATDEDNQGASKALQDEIAGRTHPGTDAPFVDVREAQQDVTRHPSATEGRPNLRLIVNNDATDDKQANSKGGGVA